MRKRYWIAGIYCAVFAALLAFGPVQTAQAQSLGEKFLPTLSLQKWIETPGTASGTLTSRDTVFVAEPGPNEKQFLILPVYIKNCLDSLTRENLVGFPGERIYSFRFKVQYNNTLLRAVGVSKRGPLPTDTAVLTKNFNMSWDVDEDPDYKLSTTGGRSANGERIMVTGSSSLPLPRSPYPQNTQGAPNPLCQLRDTSVFVYLVFEVIGSAVGGSSGITADQVIITRDSLRWNDYPLFDPNTGLVPQEMRTRGFAQFQAGVAPSPTFPINYPNDHGSVIVEVTRKPRVDLLPPNLVRRVPPGDDSNYELTFPLQTTYGNGNFIYRNVLLVNGVPGAKLRNFTIETDEPWLRIDTNAPDIPPGVREGGSQPNYRGISVRRIGEQLNLNIIANPEMLPADANGYPTPGYYEGYITIRAYDVQNSSVRVRVPLYVYRNPLEAQLDDTEESRRPRGIRLLFRNSNVNPDTTYLTFGTGLGASDGVDTIFGERQAATPPTPGSFYARFFPPSLGAGFNGMVDVRGLYTTPGLLPLSTTGEASLDIRNFRADSTLVYCVKFDAGGPEKYPIIIEYDVTDFPADGNLLFRESVTGQGNVVDLRSGTQVSGTRRAIFIRDPNVKEFCIEYTLPSVRQFPEINRGWNLVSLPVNPTDPKASTVFPNSTSGAILFSQNQYSKVDTVRPGFGYFVKYGAVRDQVVSGVPVREIAPNSFPVKVFEGWNTVGALSTPTEVSQIGFASFNSIPPPQLDAEVWRYVTNRGYEQVSRILPGYGYWIKVSGIGYYVLRPLPTNQKLAPSAVTARPYDALNNLTISDDGQNSSSLLRFGFGSVDVKRYEMPPVLGEDFFDVRFANNAFVSSSNNPNGEHIVQLSGVTYPVVLSVDKADADYVVTDAETGEVLGTLESNGGAVRVFDAATKAVKLTRVATAQLELSEAYPNPTSEKATISFAVPGEQFVTIGLFNSLGEKVGQLFQGTVDGRKSVEFSTENLPAGVYLYKMVTANGSEARHIVVSK